ncbi:MAG: ribonucleoside-diphosphate reductase, adenosylcobalamin-dependent [Candidatus Buchananbacteria bacterium RIFCSPHIGHO2_02_FULL_40_13]|uniref:Vitamin B12-dependent ribonucleotide reductase n=1 Tax=Candidatus Buchananbacteria bacterium RIFCSPLOWO2_01_FULL_39_33 TaxID=1797543 RepID=A0A1G1YKR6_9BACT|nr:MAG: ribonucleoside-diphosphate reductase, adenosylcobalamin-dependent [Candidatus Buchananbacteria bacterium RIFCSPHIGHO2_01_FULL_40_35]OGY50866.1 MAG: ribonucleoside-diphosphate reductase, adenosylcobalamin-dependent [Candidatus Buchananbacteria bacterium RIFCSPHIGHO2_02_FULL_40_13]OGY52933.1 MAG: ribonucleoside-diphosphate reductase, adenosylcobalamin-dependent [Candidatus Buchananbacteria bacterium RIFCSPLOWO2_01_FULL_39_33]
MEDKAINWPDSRANVLESGQIAKIRKRDGRIVDFNSDKIKQAITKAFTASNNYDYDLVDKLTDSVIKVLNKKYDPESIPSIEDIQNIVEIILIHNDLPVVAKNYIIYRETRAKSRERQKAILDGLTTGLPYSDNALKVMAKRYLKKDQNDKVCETPEQMMERVAAALAEVERQYGKSDEEIKKVKDGFYEVLSSFEFTPAGRTLTNAGTDLPVVANCIVLNIEDSMDSIFDTLKDASLLQQSGSGLGFPFHTLRPAGSRARKSRGVASGPVSFLKVYDRAFGVIKQQNRHGANMAVMNVEHPDILEFIHSKAKEGEIKNFNISVGLTDRFMEAVEKNDPNIWVPRFNNQDHPLQRVIRDEQDTILEIIEEKMTAREIFNEIISAAWSNGEPGCVFLDTVNKVNPLPGLGRIEACNPCGEQFLHDGDVCNLGSINLEKFAAGGEALLERLKYVTQVAVRLLDNVTDITNYQSPKVNNVSKDNRRIGLGIMGFADLLYKLGIGYNTAKGLAMAEKIMKTIQVSAHEMSQKLAEEKGVFKNYDKSIYKIQGLKMRNAALTNIAPTGTISMTMDVSGGVEPYFALAYYYKHVLGGDVDLVYFNKHLEKALKEQGYYTEEIKNQIVKNGSVQNIAGLPENIKKVFVTSMDISAVDHIKMQATFQKYCDNAISKTVNFPYSASKSDVMDGYLLAWRLGCKGCTVYRDGSRDKQILNIAKDEPLDPNAGLTDEMPMVNTSSVPTEGYQAPRPVGKKEVMASGVCPNCDGPIIIAEGCYTCANCALSACSI